MKDFFNVLLFVVVMAFDKTLQEEIGQEVNL